MFPELRLSGVSQMSISITSFGPGTYLLIAKRGAFVLSILVDLYILAVGNLTVTADLQLQEGVVYRHNLQNIRLLPCNSRALMFLCLENDLTAFWICNGMHSHLQVITQWSLILCTAFPLSRGLSLTLSHLILITALRGRQRVCVNLQFSSVETKVSESWTVVYRDCTATRSEPGILNILIPKPVFFLELTLAVTLGIYLTPLCDSFPITKLGRRLPPGVTARGIKWDYLGKQLLTHKACVLPKWGIVATCTLNLPWTVTEKTNKKTHTK